MAHRIREMSALQLAGVAVGSYVAYKAGRGLLHIISPNKFPGNPNTVMLASPSTTSIEEAKEYDYIIVGGGTAGCVLAARLTEDPNVSVLVIETGHSDLKQLMSKIPAGFPELFGKAAAYNFDSTPQDHVNGRQLYQPRGKMLGGCSAINAMIYQRCWPADYDEWASEYGCSGWSYQDLLPYFKKAETFTSNEKHPIKDESHHGKTGPWQIGYSWISAATRKFVNACDSVGIKAIDDHNSPDGQIGAAVVQTFIDTKGQRSSAAAAYFNAEVARRPNLKIATGQTVTRILFDQGSGKPRAIGVEMQASRASPIGYRARARRDVIVCAGAFHTPQILKLSGIGPADELKKHDITILKDTPGVGAELQDHPCTFVLHRFAKGETLNPLTAPPAQFKALIEWLRFGTGPMTTNAAEAMSFLRTKDHGAPESIGNEAPGDSPDLEILFGPVHYLDHGRTKPKSEIYEDYVSVGPILIRPKSRGTVTLASASPFDAPIIDPRYLSEKVDMDTLIFGTRLADKICHSGELGQSLGSFVKCAGITKTISEATDEELAEYVRNSLETIYHPTSTARMGPASSGAVVDPSNLKVHGFEGLRVCDASIFPRIVGGHPCAPVVAVAEKFADVLKGKH